MGNRAVITTEAKELAIYLHWNGGRDSVEAFLKYCELQGYRKPENDSYGFARLCQVIGNFFGGSDSLGIHVVKNDNDLDLGDNGAYIIKDWQIIDRLYFDYEEQHEYDLKEMLLHIDSKMPESDQLGELFLNCDDVETIKLNKGDKIVCAIKYDSQPEEFEVIGFGEIGQVVNGQNVAGVPYVNAYDNGCSNINNYLTDTKYRRSYATPVFTKEYATFGSDVDCVSYEKFNDRIEFLNDLLSKDYTKCSDCETKFCIKLIKRMGLELINTDCETATNEDYKRREDAIENSTQLINKFDFE